jgi:hypothetical protein
MFGALEIIDARGSDELQILSTALDLLGQHRNRDEIPTIVLDSEAAIGALVRRTFEAHLSEHPKAFELTAFRGSEPAVRDPRSFSTKRDECYFNFTQWIAKGGALPPHDMLREELRHFLWVEGRGKNRTRAIPKVHWQRQIKRSPDSADAVALSCWQDPTAFEELQAEKAKKGSPEWWAAEEERMFNEACDRAQKGNSPFDHMLDGSIPDLNLPRRW